MEFSKNTVKNVDFEVLKHTSKVQNAEIVLELKQFFNLITLMRDTEVNQTLNYSYNHY